MENLGGSGSIGRRIVLGLAFVVGSGFAGLSGVVRVASGEGLSGVSIALRGNPDRTTVSGEGGRWSLGSTAIQATGRGHMLPTRNLVFRDGRLVVSFGSVAADGRTIEGYEGAGADFRFVGRVASTTDTLVFSLCAAKVMLPIGSMDSGSIVVVLDTTGKGRGCDASQPTVPVLGVPTSYGNVTTYGGVDTTLTSGGGACNYGITGVRFYAAIQVNLQPGDGAGQWRDGKACGQAARVRAYTPQGVRETYVRIMDKCPDAHCGIDLGGAPAAAIMGVQAGRYQGEWTFVSAKGRPELSDGPPHLWTKEGTSSHWSLVQVRNPWTAVETIRWRPVAAGAAGSAAWADMTWAIEAENFFKVPLGVFASSDSVDVMVRYVDSSSQVVRLAPLDLAREKASYSLPEGGP